MSGGDSVWWVEQGTACELGGEGYGARGGVLGSALRVMVRLAVGVYHPDTGERLPINEPPAGFTVDEQRLFLPGEIVY